MDTFDLIDCSENNLEQLKRELAEESSKKPGALFLLVISLLVAFTRAYLGGLISIIFELVAIGLSMLIEKNQKKKIDRLANEVTLIELREMPLPSQE
jgi:hypothetical protein